MEFDQMSECKSGSLDADQLNVFSFQALRSARNARNSEIILNKDCIV